MQHCKSCTEAAAVAEGCLWPGLKPLQTSWLGLHMLCWLSAGQGQGEAAVATSGDDGEVLYNMTGQTGSLMYMAPEV